jgi:hypothetical protein
MTPEDTIEQGGVPRGRVVWLQGEAPVVLYPALYKHSKRKNRSLLDAMTLNRWIGYIDYNMTQQLIADFISLWERVHDVVLS